jgi:membrane-bound lytic murein transglycosylase D
MLKLTASLLLCLCSFTVVFAQTTTKEPSANNLQINSPKLTVPNLPDSFSLFGEQVPLHVWDVKERFDRELLINSYLQGSTLYLLKLYGRWMPMIEARLKANGIPDDFKFLCVAESALQNQVSKVGATGFWQFMRTTAPSFGLEVNGEVDERYNPEKSTDAACRYLKSAYQKFGNWTAAAASYNCGMGNYNSAITTQGTQNYYQLLLPEETMRYMFRIMALKHILQNPEQSGFIIRANEQYSPLNVKRVEVNHSIYSLVQFAKSNHTDYKTIKLLNPWLRGKSLSNRSRKTYQILLPLSN